MIANHAVGNILANSTVRKKRMRNCQCLGCFFQLKCVCVHSTAAVFTLPVIWIPRRKWCFCRTVIWKCLCGQTHQKRPWFQPKKLNSINYHFSGTKYKSQARCTFTWTWNIFFWIGTMCIINANKGLHRLLHQLLWHGRSVLQPLQFPEFHGCLASQNMICNCVYTCWLKKCAFHVFMYPCMYACMHVCMYVCLYVCGRSVVSTVSNLQCCCCCSMNAYPAPIPCLAWPLTSKMPGMDPAKETVLISPGLLYPNLGFQACWKKINKICWKKTCLAVFFAPPVEIVD